MNRNEEQIRKSMLHYLEGSVHPEELEHLNRVVETDPAARRDLAELLLQDVLLTKLSQETEFFELDEPAPAARPASSTFRTSRIMRIQQRPAPARSPEFRTVAMIAAVVLFAVSVALAVNFLKPTGPDAVMTTVMPISTPVTPSAPAAAETPVEPPVKTVVATEEPPAPPVPSKAKPPVRKPKAPTAKTDSAADSKPAPIVPEGALTQPASAKIAPAPLPKTGPTKPPPNNKK